MAGKFGSASLIYLVDGFNFLAPKIKGTLSVKISQLTEEASGLGDAQEMNYAVGKQRGTVTQGAALFDTASKSIHDAMSTNLGTSPQSTARVMCIGVMGNTVGAVLYGIAAAFSVAYEGLLTVGKLTKASAEHLMAGLIERGQIVQPLATKAASWNTHTLATPVDFTTDPSQYTIPITSNTAANPSVVTTPVPHGLTTGQIILIAGVATSSPTINGERTVTVISATTFSVPVNVATPGTGGSFVLSNTVNGGAGYQQVGDFAGTSYVGKINHSADESSYATIVTFTTVTAANKAERITVAPGTTIQRYLAHDGTVTSATLDAMSGFCRN